MPEGSRASAVSAEESRTAIHRYGVALIVTGLCFGLTLLAAFFVGRSIFQLALVAVVLSAWYGGLGPGLLSASVSALALAFFVLEPRYSFLIQSADETLQFTVFLMVAVLMSTLSNARHKAERALRIRSEELLAVNRELEAFSYSVSHDLRRPLRAIDGYSRILVEKHAGQLTPDARRYLELVRSCTQETGQLVDDLLAFARLGRQPVSKRLIDPVELVQQSLEDLKAEQEGREVEIAIGYLSACEADPVLLKLVFLNLLQNALKFTRKRQKAVIEIGSEGSWGYPVYYVKDNGMGFNMEYADQVFGVFKRLHRSEDYEGTGVGLAIAQRIIQRHGGRIWVEAEPDKGATFFFEVQARIQNVSPSN
jgi:light-regulated signal transduction histidine kinase (bacteriophytochrome)